jgi:ATP-binding cassette subfamily B protein
MAGGDSTKPPAAVRAREQQRQMREGVMPVRTWRERLDALKNVPPFLKLIWNTSRTLTIATLIIRVIRAVLPVVTLYVGKLIIDEVIHLAKTPSAPTGWSAWLASGLLHRVTLLVISEFVLAIVSDVLSRVVSLIDGLLSAKAGIVTSIRIMEHAATLDLEDFEDSELQDRIERARQQASGGMSLMSQLFGQAQEVLTIATFAVGLLVFAPWLIALLILTLVPAFVGEAHFNALSYALNFSRSQQRRELEYIRYTGASVETAKEVKIFGLNEFLTDRFRVLAMDSYDATRTLSFKRARWGSLLTAFGTIGYYVAYAYIVWRTIAGQFTVGDLTFLAGSFARLRSSLEGLLSGFTQVAGQALYLDDLFSFFKIEPAIHSPGESRKFPYPIKEGFVFEDVGFKYQSAERWAVRHLNFTLGAGEVIALVGENGAGKTTLVKLLARLYDPGEGRILLDGHDLREYDLDELRGNMGVIFQDFIRYQFTAAENIAVGRIAERSDRPRIEIAARQSLADELIQKLPEKYDQILGKRFRTGIDLSGGEWQKVAIARAYMRDAQVLILDEPTAALDARAEYQVFQRFKELSQNKSAVLISHRFSTVRMADRILVMSKGELEAVGTHKELLAQNGRYAELFELQAAGYR